MGGRGVLILRKPANASLGFVARMVASMSRQLARAWCGLHGHLIMMHFEPHKLSLQCALCGYQSPGWDVGRPMAMRRSVDRPAKIETHAHPHLVRVERRRTLRAVPSSARLAS